MQYFNGQKIHSRHGKTRYQAWQKIQSEQLILPPPAEYCRELVLSKPDTRKVKPELTVDFEGREFDVSKVTFVMVGEKIMVVKKPSQPYSIQAQCFDT